MDDNCTVYKTLELVGKKWNLLIIQVIYKGGQKKKRYSEIKNNLNEITAKILSARLKEMEAEEFITKEIDTSHIPISTYYSLTKKGEALIKVIQDLKKWGLEWEFTNKKCEGSNCKYCRL